MSARDEGGAYARIRENLSELGLDAMAAGLPHWMSAVAAGEADFASAMLAMTSEEAEAKRRRGTDRKVRAAGFPFVKTLADFDFSFQPSIPRAVVDDLAALRFLDAAENVVLVGSPGVGKTHIAVALGVEAVRARKEVRFTDCAALVRDLKDASSRRCSSSTSWGTWTWTRRGPTCCSSSSRPATSTAPRSSPPTWPWAFGPTCSGTR